MTSSEQIEAEMKQAVNIAIASEFENLQKPSCAFFASWTFTNSEGRIASIWEQKNNELTIDEDTLRLSKIWSFIFPEMRENYLIERIWKRMSVEEEVTKAVSISFYNTSEELKIEGAININKRFISGLNGHILKEQIDLKYKLLEAKYKLLEACSEKKPCELKIARILKYDIDFNNKQIEGIDEAFSEWIIGVDDKTRISLNKLFLELYGKDIPSKHPIAARNFLTMWQNFSVVFPNYSHVVLYFNNFGPNVEARSVLAVFYKDIPINDSLIMSTLTEIASKASSRLVLEAYKASTTKVANEYDVYSLWNEVKKKPRNSFLWEKLLEKHLTNSHNLDNLMELAGKLSFSMHESHACRFSFIAGTEQIWPVIEETISLKFHEHKQQKNFNADLFANLCEANYSIFQVDGVVGFYNTEFQSMSKIVRLRYPGKEELRDIEEPISDIDDLFCWAISKIHKETAHKSFIVYTQGNGKVSVYGKSDDRINGDLLLIWDVRKGEIYEPIPENELAEIEKALTKIYPDDDKRKYSDRLIKAVRKISTTPGEGACLIISNKKVHVGKYLTDMEQLKPTWFQSLSLDDPLYILKASFIMDGACLITGSNIEPRQAVYPHHDSLTWGLNDLVEDPRFKHHKDKIINKQSGKGSKTHCSANISSLPGINVDPAEPMVVVVSISADGPIKVWPQELVKNI